jgi:hypothetical protein
MDCARAVRECQLETHKSRLYSRRNEKRDEDFSSSLPSSVHNFPAAKLEMMLGAFESKPTTSSILTSFGSAIDKPLEVMPPTTSRAAMPICWVLAQRHVRVNLAPLGQLQSCEWLPRGL